MKPICVRRGLPRFSPRRNSVKVYPDRQCLGWRETNADGSVSDYKWLTYTQAHEKVKMGARWMDEVS